MGLRSVCGSKSTGLDLAEQSNLTLQITDLNQHAGFWTCVFEQALNTKTECMLTFCSPLVGSCNLSDCFNVASSAT